MAGYAHMKPAMWMMYLSALLHFLAPMASGFTFASVVLVPIGLVWTVIGWLLMTRGWRGLAWIGFFLALIGMVAGLIGVAGVAAWVMTGIALADLAAAVCLFVVLWRDRPEIDAA